MERIFHLQNDDLLTCTEQAAVFRFSGPRAVLSTGANNGGLRYDLTAAYNYSDCGTAGTCRPMDGKNLLEHQRAVAKRIGLDPDRATGLDTAANLDNMVVVTKSWDALSITAAVSGGADINALCAGDPAFLTEQDGEPTAAAPGTINIFLVTDRTLSPGAMVELVTTATEAKTSVLRDLMQGSTVSSALATGTGTDGVVVICGMDEKPLLNGGKHFKLGELAALAVKESVAEALFRQTGFCACGQHTVLKRLLRFGITAESLSSRCQVCSSEDHALIMRVIDKLNRDSFLVSATALYVHLEDQCRAGMLTEMEAEDWSEHLLNEIQRHYQCKLPPHHRQKRMEKMEDALCALLLAHLKEQAALYPSSPLC